MFFSLFWLGAHCGYFGCFPEVALHWEMVCSLSARREQRSYLVWVVASFNQCWRHLRLLHILILFGLEYLESAPLPKSMLGPIVRLLHCLQKQRLSKGTQFLAVFFFRFSVCFVEPYPDTFPPSDGYMASLTHMGESSRTLMKCMFQLDRSLTSRDGMMKNCEAGMLTSYKSQPSILTKSGLIVCLT